MININAIHHSYPNQPACQVELSVFPQGKEEAKIRAGIKKDFSMKIGIPKELPPEQRVASTPEIITKMVQKGRQVLLESDAGEKAFIPNQAYEKAGARLVTRAVLYEESDLILKVTRPDWQEIELLPEKTILIAPYSLRHLDELQKLQHKKITVFSLNQLPRLARTQSMDILSSMSSIAGYKSIMLAAHYLGKLFPMMTTAAGTIQAVKVLVLGAGVAGLQAIATARRLGALVLAFDTRPLAEEQVKSLGADFVSLASSTEETQDAGGYAKEQATAFYQKEQEILRPYLSDADVVVTTALIPGKAAPLLISADMVREMKPGSVLIDLAIEEGGNCELSEPGKISLQHGVRLIGLLNLPSLLPVHASQLYARNLFNFIEYLYPQLEKNEFDYSDEIIKNCLLTHQGEFINPVLQANLEKIKEVA